MESVSLPVIDLLDSDDDHLEKTTLRQWNEAFSTYGFCYLSSKSHGLAPLLQRVEELALEFFTTLTPNEKAAYYLNKGYGHGGYVAPGIEQVAASKNNQETKHQPDLVESLCVHSGKAEHVPPFSAEEGLLPDVPYKHGDEFKEAVRELWKGLESVLKKVMRLSANALELPDDFFDKFYQPGANFLRFAHYVDGAADEIINEKQNGKDKEQVLRYGEHTDYQGFTLLWRNQTNGLQCARNMRHYIQTQEEIKEWIDVPILEDDPHAIVVNAGDLIQRWTNDYWVSNMHRVVKEQSSSPPSASPPKESLSIVFFTGPENETKVQMLPSPLLRDEHPKYDVIGAGEHLLMKIQPTSKTS